MSRALAINSRPIAIELHRLLRDLDPSRWRNDAERAFRDRIEQLANTLNSIVPASQRVAHRAVLRQRLLHLGELLRSRVPNAGLPLRERLSAWREYRVQLQESYDALSVALRPWSVHIPHLRPSNYTRSLFHVGMAIGVILLVEHVLSAPQRIWVPLTFAACCWTVELGRRFHSGFNDVVMRLFRPIAHPHEQRRVNSATWFATAMALLGTTFSPPLCVVAVIILGVADPAAALVGRRWGRTKLLHGRTLEGTMTFIAAGTIAALAVLLFYHSALGFTTSLAIAFTASLAAAIAELTSLRIDDNFSIPVIAASAAWLAMQLL